MNIGILGCGSIAKTLINFKLDGKLNFNIVCFYDQKIESSTELANMLDCDVANNIDELIEKSDLVLEAASQQAVKSLVPTILESGTDVMIMSVGSLLSAGFKEELETIAFENNAKIYLPTGAIAGIDAVKAAVLGDIESVSLITRKPPSSLGIDLEGTDEKVIFEGKASEAVTKFPKNINVSSTLSLASGIDATVKIIADSKVEQNTHEIHLKGSFGQLTTQTKNFSSPENPKTSILAAYSAASLLNKLSQTLQIGS